MKSLDVLKDICTNIHRITSSRSQYDQKLIKKFPHIFNCGFDHFRHHFSNVNHFLGTIHSIWSKQNLKTVFTWKCHCQYAVLAHIRYISCFSIKSQKSVLSMFSSIANSISTFDSQMFHDQKVWYFSFQTQNILDIISNVRLLATFFQRFHIWIHWWYLKNAELNEERDYEKILALVHFRARAPV